MPLIPMLALLHTSPAHVETFARLARELDPAVPVRHEVRADLLAGVLAAGCVTNDVRSAVTHVVRSLAHDGARVIVCTCSTIGGLVEATEVPSHVRLMRIDRPMAEQAVASNRRVLVLAALRSTFEPTTTLLRHAAAEANRTIEVVEIHCESAWPHFERGDHAAYLGEIARTIEHEARPTDLVLLAQASMANAAELVDDLGIPVLSSPRLGMSAALSLYRTANL